MAVTVHPIVLDTDIGTDVDDVVALVAALRTPEVELRAVTTVYVDTELRARMVQAVLTTAGRRDIPVGAGVGAPLLGRDPLYWGGWEGEGLIEVGPARPGASPTVGTLSGAFPHGVDLLIETVLAQPGAVTVLAIGPLTNLAVALTREPRLAGAVKRIVIMGGLVQRRLDQLDMGYVEHNIRCDPEAASIVLRSGAPITLVPLDVTTQSRLRRADLPRIAGAGALGALAADQVERYLRQRNRDWTHPHDALALAAIAQPGLLSTTPMRVQVETQGQLTRAQTVATLAPGGAEHEPGAARPIEVALQVDVAAFEGWLVRTLATP